jgi:tRNA1Val (adenine37-N6)-methyltransferase
MLEEKKAIQKPFRFKQFTVEQDRCAMKVGTDGVLLGAWANVAQAETILDIGTGTGVIAIMAAQRTVATQAQVDGVEIDESAYLQAKENMAKSPFATRLTAIHQSIQDFEPASGRKYDVIISNPPFFTGGTFSGNQEKNNVRHTVKLPHGDLLHATQRLLNKNGRFCLILPWLEGLRFIEIARNYHFYCTVMREVRPKPGKNIERLLLQFEWQDKKMVKDELILMLENGQRNDYTPEYIQLTNEFYTIF